MGTSFWSEGLCNHWNKAVKTSQQDLNQCHMVSKWGIFYSFFFFFNFQEHLEAFVQVLMEFTIAFVLLRNHCPFYLSLLERQLLQAHYVLGSNIFRRGDKHFSRIRKFLSFRHTQQRRTEIHSTRRVVFLALLICSVTSGDTKKS